MRALTGQGKRRDAAKPTGKRVSRPGRIWSVSALPRMREAVDVVRAGRGGGAGINRAGGITRSERLDQIAARYLSTMRHATPHLASTEWGFLLDLLRPWPRDEQTAALLPGDVRAADKGLEAKWGVDADALGRSLEGLPHAALVALLEVADRYWGRVGAGEGGDFLDLLRAAGARCTAPESGTAPLAGKKSACKR